MIFKAKDNTILGQSWVWYDELHKKICLDNIEVPKLILQTKLKSKETQKDFLHCLKRMVKNFLQEMKKKGLEVNSITIGKGYTDIKDILEENYILSNTEPILSDYTGYTDAKVQYILYKKSNL